MIPLGQEFSPISNIEANIQARVAEFLGSKKRLTQLMTSSILTVQGKAKDLYAVQLKLEEELQTALKTIENVKAGSYSISDILSTGAFYYTMDSHIRAVDDLWDENAKGGGKLSTGLDVKSLLLPAAIIGGLWFIFRRR